MLHFFINTKDFILINLGTISIHYIITIVFCQTRHSHYALFTYYLKKNYDMVGIKIDLHGDIQGAFTKMDTSGAERKKVVLRL